MTAGANISQQVSKLVESNRALLEELRGHQRREASLAQRRDTLRGEFERLDQDDQPAPTCAPGPSWADVAEVRELLATERRHALRLRRERSAVGREAALVREELDPIEAHMGTLMQAVQELEDEREAIAREVTATMAAMADIKSCLESQFVV